MKLELKSEEDYPAVHKADHRFATALNNRPPLFPSERATFTECDVPRYVLFIAYFAPFYRWLTEKLLRAISAIRIIKMRDMPCMSSA